MTKKAVIHHLSDLLTPSALELLSANGSELVRQIGLDAVRGVVLDILCGRNLRDSTEVLTRRRIAALNLATLTLFFKGSSLSDDSIADLPALSQEILSRKRIDKAERWLAQWMLGLTDKAFQNILRDEPKALQDYSERYIRTCQDVIVAHANEQGELQGQIQLSGVLKAQINWLWMTYLLNAIGAQTLAIRGSGKSAYGNCSKNLFWVLFCIFWDSSIYCRLPMNLQTFFGFRHEVNGARVTQRCSTDQARVFTLILASSGGVTPR